jgi:hypothetical protein
VLIFGAPDSVRCAPDTDVQYKPHGLTSLSRYDLSQVHKVQHKWRKNSVRGHNLFGAKRTWVCWFLAHQTVSGAPGRTTDEPATLGNLEARFAIIHWTVQEAKHPPQISLVFFLLLGHHLGAETTKLSCFITYNNMGSKTGVQSVLSQVLPIKGKRLSRICWLLGTKVKLIKIQRLCLQKSLL